MQYIIILTLVQESSAFYKITTLGTIILLREMSYRVLLPFIKHCSLPVIVSKKKQISATQLISKETLASWDFCHLELRTLYNYVLIDT